MADDEGGKEKREPKDQKRREQVLVGAAIAGVVLTVLILKRSSAQAAQSAAPQYGQIPATGAGGFAGGSGPDYADLNAQFHGIGTQLDAINASIGALAGSSSPTPISTNPTPEAPPVPVAPPPPPAPSFVNPQQAFVGSGYGPGTQSPVYDTGGGSYSWISSASAVPGILAAGESTYYEPTPGHFVPTTPNSGLLPGTPQFVHN